MDLFGRNRWKMADRSGMHCSSGVKRGRPIIPTSTSPISAVLGTMDWHFAPCCTLSYPMPLLLKIWRPATCATTFKWLSKRLNPSAFLRRWISMNWPLRIDPIGSRSWLISPLSTSILMLNNKRKIPLESDTLWIWMGSICVRDQDSHQALISGFRFTPWFSIYSANNEIRVPDLCGKYAVYRRCHSGHPAKRTTTVLISLILMYSVFFNRQCCNGTKPNSPSSIICCNVCCINTHDQYLKKYISLCFFSL